MKSLSVTIQTKATEQYFPVVLFIMLYKEVKRLDAWSVTIQMKTFQRTNKSCNEKCSISKPSDKKEILT